MKSVDGGKSYGKSSTGRSMLWLASCPEEGKVKASLKIEVMFEKFSSFVLSRLDLKHVFLNMALFCGGR